MQEFPCKHLPKDTQAVPDIVYIAYLLERILRQVVKFTNAHMLNLTKCLKRCQALEELTLTIAKLNKTGGEFT
jgi:hypothetical protein